MPNRATLPRMSWTMVDQGLVSVGNFLLNVLLARNLSPEEYGTFALIFGAFLGLQLFNASLLSYPLSIGLPVVAREDEQRLVATNFVLMLGMCLPLGSALAAGLLIFGRADLILPALTAFVFLQGQETLRRCLMAGFRHRAAALGDAVTYLGQATIVFILVMSEGLSVATSLLAMATASCVGALIQAWQLRLAIAAAGRFAETIKSNCAIGGYSLANNLVSLLRLQLLPWCLAAASGAGAAASFQAMINVINLANPIILGLCNIIPQAAAAAKATGHGEAWRSARTYALLGAPLTLGFYALIFAVPYEFLYGFYGAGSPYLALGPVMRIMLVAWAASYVTDMICSYLHGIDQAKSAFEINFLGVVAIAVMAGPMTAFWGLNGAAVAILGANVLRLLPSYFLLARTIANEGRA